MLIHRAYQHKLRFSKQQEQLACEYAGCARKIYNMGLRHREKLYRNSAKSIGYKAQTYHLKALKRDPDYDYLQKPPAQVLQQSLKDLNTAYKNFFMGTAKYPQTHKKGINDSFRYPQPEQIKTGNPEYQGHVYLPKLGWVSVINCYPRLGSDFFAGSLKSVTVSKQGNHWYASFNVEEEIADPIRPCGEYPRGTQVPKKGQTRADPRPWIGIDLGITNSFATSEGDLSSLPTITQDEWKKLSRLQAQVSSKQKGSANRWKAQAKLDRYRTHLVNRKRDAIHQWTTQMTKAYQVMVIEDLKVKNMSSSARGTVENPGTNVAQKSGLNRAILDQCWGEIRRQLQYKSNWYGSTLLTVNPAYTSQACSNCQHTTSENRESQAVFCCVKCGHQAHADTNAAKNILTRGLVSPWTAGTADRACKAHACAHTQMLKTPEFEYRSRKTDPRGLDPEGALVSGTPKPPT